MTSTTTFHLVRQGTAAKLGANSTGISVNGRELSGKDTAAIDTYREHADLLDESVPPSAITGEPSHTKTYERLISRAFWALAARCQEGR